MHYDPIKSIIGNTVRAIPIVRVLFYKALGAIFLREWYVKQELRRQLADRTQPFDVYDAGSGFGQYSYFIATRFPHARIHAVDVKTEQIADCSVFFNERGISNCLFSVEDLTQIVHTNRFDLVLSVDVMEHIPDDIGVFRNFYRALKPGGTLIINTPSNLGGSDAHDEHAESFIGEHARNGYGADEIRTKLESTGFRVDSVRYTYGVWGSRYWHLALKYPMMLLNVSNVFFIILPVYYLFVFPIVLPMMYLDYTSENTTGTGLNVVARKIGN
jgi:SAM-dependent methyltransferase